MTISNDVLNAALAGLLHDVGKFAQRAGEQVTNEWSEGKTKADFGYQHALHTWHFANRYLPDPIKQTICPMAAFHHRPSGRGIVIQVADHLSAGERRKDGLALDDSDRKIHPKQLQPVFGAITTKRTDKDGKEILDRWPQTLYFGLSHLALQEQIVFPSTNKLDEKKEVWDAYQSLWNAFCSEANNLKKVFEQSQDWNAYLEAMLSLYQRYAWCVPSAYFNAVPDVSLYDHSRMTAALAAVLVDIPEATLEQIAGDPEHDKTEVALLIGGDISGVQNFIYTITNKGATSALRGRSFYLQLLTEATARFVLRELGLPYVNLIYGGGGNFYILARVSDADKLPNLRQKLSRILYKHHQGDLYIAIEGLRLQAWQFIRPQGKNPDGTEKRHPLSDAWDELTRRVSIIKNKRFSDLERDELEALFTPHGHGGNEESQCIVCGREYIPKRNPDEKEKGKCPACVSYEDLGRDLRNAHFIAWKLLNHPKQVSPIGTGGESGEWWRVLNHLGFEVHVEEKTSSLPNDANIVWALSDDAFFSKASKSKKFPLLVRRLLVNVTPKLSEPFVSDDNQYFQPNDIKPFEKLAKDSNGITRLGIFRADVDNLGKLFAEGLGSNATLSRIASLSFAISLFFEGWVGKIAETWNKEHGDRIYAIYSGGDDLFFVGSWDELVEFAWQVNEDLKMYVCHHPGIHLSGGLTLATSKYPLAKAARDTEQAEKAAKAMEWWDEQGNPHKKNVFSFLGQPLPWDEFKNARKLKERLEKLEESKRTAVIRKLLMNYAFYAQAQEKRRKAGKDRKVQGKPQTLYGPWNWRIVYLLRRTFGREKENGNLDTAKIITDFHIHPDMLEYTGMAARWVELLKRDTSEKE